MPCELPELIMLPPAPADWVTGTRGGIIYRRENGTLEKVSLNLVIKYKFEGEVIGFRTVDITSTTLINWGLTDSQNSFEQLIEAFEAAQVNASDLAIAPDAAVVKLWEIFGSERIPFDRIWKGDV